MKKWMCISAIIFIIILLTIIVLHFKITRYHTYLTAQNPDGRYFAQIVWKRVFPYIQGVDAFLIVKDLQNDETKLRQVLLENRDCFADIEYEFRGLSWDGDNVVLEIKSLHYKGPKKFKIRGE